MMKQVENYKDVEIVGRTFRIKKFNALTGSFMLIKIIGILAPLFKNVDTSKLKDAKDVSGVDVQAFNIPGIMEALGSLSESDFNYVQEKSLDVCSEVLQSGLTPVRNPNGSFGVTGLEEDTMSVMALTVHALIFNVKGFFQGSPLASMVGGLLNISQQD